jgi:hypothetical protein
VDGRNKSGQDGFKLYVHQCATESELARVSPDSPALAFAGMTGNLLILRSAFLGQALGAPRKRVIFIDIRASGSEVAVSPPAGKWAPAIRYDLPEDRVPRRKDRPYPRPACVPSAVMKRQGLGIGEDQCGLIKGKVSQ